MDKKKNQKKNKKSKINFIISACFFLLSCVLSFFLISLKILPNKYLTIVIGGLLVVNLILFISLTFTKNIFVKVISVLGCVGLAYGVYSLGNTNSLLNSMHINYKTNNYVVLVKSDSSYESIKDLDGKTIGYLVDDKLILDKIKIKYTPTEYNDVNVMVNNLLDNDIEGIILEQSYVDMLTEEGSPINYFDEKTRVIYDFKVNTKVNDISKDVDTTSSAFCIYISGIDTYGSVSSVSRTDANMLVIVNPTTKQILLVSIPRDYYINLSGKNSKDKLTHSGIYGIDTTVKSVEKLLGIDINYYFKINFTSLINIVDSVNGVDVYSKYTFTSKDGYNYTKGYNHVNGKEALSFVRERKAFNAGDRVRNINQQALLEALLRKCTNSSILTKYNSLLNNMKNSFVTNMPTNSMTALIKKQLENNTKWNVTSIGLDGSNSMEYTYSYKSSKLYVMIPDDNTINRAKNMIKDVFDGKTLDSSYNTDVTNIQTVTKTNKAKKITSNTSNTSNTIKNSNNNIKKYNVTYIIDGVSTTIQVEEGSKLIEKSIPDKDNYKAIGWFFQGNIFDFSTPITQDITLEAKYEENNIIEEQIEDGIIEEPIDSNENEKID